MAQAGTLLLTVVTFVTLHSQDLEQWRRFNGRSVDFTQPDYNNRAG
jgi:hypothetical protein